MCRHRGAGVGSRDKRIEIGHCCSSRVAQLTDKSQQKIDNKLFTRNTQLLHMQEFLAVVSLSITLASWRVIVSFDAFVSISSQYIRNPLIALLYYILGRLGKFHRFSVLGNALSTLTLSITLIGISSIPPKSHNVNIGNTLLNTPN